MNRSSISSLLFTSFLLCSSLTSQAETPILSDPSEVDMSAERLQRIGAWMDHSIANKDFAGGVTLVARCGKVVHLESHGWFYEEENIPMRDDTIFRLASMTKPVASIALLMLWEEGHFNLDDPISKWLPAYENMMVRETDAVGNEYLVPAARPISVRHIMTHSVAFDNTMPERPATVEEQVNIIAARPLEDHPGDAWYYRSATNQVGVLVEKISGMTLDDFLRERLFEPLDMVDTHFNVPMEKLDRVAAIYGPDENLDYQLINPPEFRPATAYFSGSGGLSSTIHDYF
ncbi:MAG: serine hydrolase domain-containing protein [Gammaproteobacteria bacterium]|nr:serine hydrolase domain-containing protein [Gammaproteobacteria bacterium]